MLLDDVVSELDGARRERLADLLRSGGQSVITTTDAEHVPGTATAGRPVVTAGCERTARADEGHATDARAPVPAGLP